MFRPDRHEQRRGVQRGHRRSGMAGKQQSSSRNHQSQVRQSALHIPTRRQLRRQIAADNPFVQEGKAVKSTIPQSKLPLDTQGKERRSGHAVQEGLCREQERRRRDQDKEAKSGRYSQQR